MTHTRITKSSERLAYDIYNNNKLMDKSFIASKGILAK